MNRNYEILRQKAMMGGYADDDYDDYDDDGDVFGHGGVVKKKLTPAKAWGRCRTISKGKEGKAKNYYCGKTGACYKTTKAKKKYCGTSNGSRYVELTKGTRKKATKKAPKKTAAKKVKGKAPKSAWMRCVAAYRKKHPKATQAEALKRASPSYRRGTCK